MAMNANEVTDSEKYHNVLKRYLGIHYTEIINLK
jgi:hypothetical protein